MLLLASTGRHTEARAILDGLTPRVTAAAGDTALSAQTLAYVLEDTVLLGERELAGALAARLKNYASFTITSGLPCVIARHLGGASALLGEQGQARDYYGQAIEVCERVRFRPELALTRLELAELLLRHYPEERPEAVEHLDFAIGELRQMQMQPSLERALRHKEVLKA